MTPMNWSLTLKDGLNGPGAKAAKALEKMTSRRGSLAGTKAVLAAMSQAWHDAHRPFSPPPRLVALMAYAATTLPQDALLDPWTTAGASGPTLPVHIVTASLRRGFGYREEHGLMMGGWARLVDAAFELRPGSKRRDWTVAFGKVLTAEGPFAAWMWAVGEAERAKEAA